MKPGNEPIGKTVNGKWIAFPELHDSKSLNSGGTYLLKSKADEFVSRTSPPPTLTVKSRDAARRFRGDYLLVTCWEWEREYEAPT